MKFFHTCETVAAIIERCCGEEKTQNVFLYKLDIYVNVTTNNDTCASGYIYVLQQTKIHVFGPQELQSETIQCGNC
jgi:hypothetical protein